MLKIDGSRKADEVKLPFAPMYETFGVCKVIKCQKGKTYVISVTNPNKNAAVGMTEYENIEKAIDVNKALGFAKVDNKILKKSYTAKSGGILVCGIAGTWTDGKTTVHECTESELLQVEEASEATTYESYRPSQIFTITSPTGLPGIPVPSGGNYTDETGQQWICDEVDLERGVYRQRIGCKEYLDASGWKHSITSKFKNHNFQTRLNSDTSAGINGRCYCNLLSYKNTSWDDVAINLPKIYAHDTEITASFPPDTNMDSIEKWDELLKKTSLQIQYILETTIETPLSEADIAAYRALTTYGPTTIVETDGAGMKLDYQRDVNIVIKQLTDTIASMTN